MTTTRFAFGLLFLTLAISSPRGQESFLPDRSVLELDPERQRLADIRVERLIRRSFSFRIATPAQVLDPSPLIEASHRFKQISRELYAQEKIAAILQGRLDRLERVGQDLRLDPLEQARWDLLSAKTRVETVELKAAQLKARLLAEWGALLCGWAENGSENLIKLARGEAYLLRLTPAQSDLPLTAALEYQGELFPLEYVGPAPKTDPVFSGSPRYYLTSSPPALTLGLRLTAWLTEAVEAIPIPRQAVIWHQGGPWVFVQISPARFERRSIRVRSQTEEGYWVEQGVEAGEEVVVQGASLLLAEELKAAIPDEDNAD